MIDSEQPHDRDPADNTGSRSSRMPLRGIVLAAGACALTVCIVVAAVFLRTRAGPSGPVWRPAGLQGTLVHAIVLGPTGVPTFAGTEGGIFQRTGNSWHRVLSSGEVWDLVSLPDGKTLFAAENAGTVAISHDGGMHWRRTMVSGGGLYAVSSVPGRPTHLLAGGDGGLFLSTDGGRQWRNTQRLRNAAADAFEWAPGGANTVYAGTVSAGPTAGQQVYVSHDAGQTWQVFGRRLRSTGGVMSVLAASNGAILAGTMGNAAWTAQAGAPVWHKTARNMPQTGDHVAGMALIPGTPERAVLGTLGHGLYLGVPGSNRWTAISGSLNNAIVLSVVYSPGRHALYAGTYTGIYTLPVRELPGKP